MSVVQEFYQNNIKRTTLSTDNVSPIVLYTYIIQNLVEQHNTLQAVFMKLIRITIGYGLVVTLHYAELIPITLAKGISVVPLHPRELHPVPESSTQLPGGSWLRSELRRFASPHLVPF